MAANVIQRRLAELKQVDSDVYYDALDKLNNVGTKDNNGNIITMMAAVDSIRQLIESKNERRAMRGYSTMIEVLF
jgi:hypothetical protein